MNANKLIKNPKKSQACVINYELRSPPSDIKLTYCQWHTQGGLGGRTQYAGWGVLPFPPFETESLFLK